MARRTTTPPQPKQAAELLVPREEARVRLQERQSKGLEIRREQIGSVQGYEKVKADYYKWDDFNTELLKRIFSTEEFSGEYSHWVGVMAIGQTSLGEDIADLHKDIERKIRRLDSIIERLELIPVAQSAEAAPQSASTSLNNKVKSLKVFVVHGHDETAKTNLEVFLREIGLEPIVLHRQADEGLTIIEKFEKHSEVGYAFILLTPDEVAYLRSEDTRPDADRKKEFRARPNVIFEFGYFVGKLGRSKVCCLYTGNVTLPSDVSGIIYKKYESSIEEVAYSVLKDLKASGYKVA